MTTDDEVVVKIDRVITRTGDGGETSLVGGQRVSKDDLRIEAYGTVDELNGVLGTCLHCSEGPAGPWRQQIQQVQQRLFDLGAELADPRSDASGSLSAADVEDLERWTEQALQDLQPLTSFVLPGGSPANAQLHLARTVCRRAERRAVSLAREQDLRPLLVRYLNRLSDYLFAASRWVIQAEELTEVLWAPRRDEG